MTIPRRYPGYITAIALFLTIVSAAQAQYSGGTGEPNDPYQIATAADLIALGETPEDYDKHFILTADIDLDPNLPGRKVFDKAVIAPDTDPNDKDSWFQGTPFTGVFDGSGHTIKNLKVTGQEYLGLFGQSTGRVSNLGLEAVELTGTLFVGALVGQNSHGRIATSYSTGSINGNSSVGGLVGHNFHGIITTSYSSATVNGIGHIGGLAGWSGRGYITSSYSSGSVNGEYGVGGLVGGDDWGIVSSSFWDIETSGQTASTGGMGKTTAEMQMENTFTDAGWDFVDETTNGTENIWWILEGQDYPRLWWENAEQ